MKILFALCAAVGLTLLATYLLVSHQRAAQYARERDLLRSGWDAERAELEAALKAAKQRSGSSRAVVSEPGTGKSAAHDILERLKKTKVLTGEHRVVSIRHIVHQLESLVDLGPEALPAIREFLAKFEDVDYSGDPHDDEKDPSRDLDSKAAERSGTATATAAAGAGRNLPRLDSFLPPSLRLGLVQMLMEMGGEQAEQILVEMLSTSGRGVEVAYVAKALQEMVPNKYRDVAVAAAKDLLANPPTIDRPNRLDENAKNFLYGVLTMYNDPTFAASAQNLLVTQDGRVDRTALTYLTGTMKEEAVPALYQAFKDNRVTNMWERAALATQILSYTGNSQQANDIFKEMVNNESLPTWLRATAIQTVAGGRGTFFGGAAATDPAQLKARLDLLNSLPEIADERLARARNEAIQKLNENLSAEPEDGSAGRSFRTRLDGGTKAPIEMPPVPGGR
jgi:hypothetical protein